MPSPGRARTFGLAHVALAVADVERAFRFYEAVFGMTAVYRSDGLLQAQTPGTRDGSSSRRGPGRLGEPAASSIFGFRLADIDKAAAITAAGGVIKDKGDFVPGEPYIFFTDPDGSEVEVWYELPTPVDPP
jgi:catechol 2,3-dioxygenase-like lactoylglutathione lyase family enzyme